MKNSKEWNKYDFYVIKTNKKEVKTMVGLESAMEMAEGAKKVKKPDVSDAERERQKAFYAKLRGRTAEQPTGAQYD